MHCFINKKRKEKTKEEMAENIKILTMVSYSSEKWVILLKSIFSFFKHF